MANQHTSGTYLAVVYTAAEAKRARKVEAGPKRIRRARLFRAEPPLTRYRDARRLVRHRLAWREQGALGEVYLKDAKGKPRLLEQHVVVRVQGVTKDYLKVIQEER